MNNVAVVVSERARTLRFRRRTSVRARPARRLPARIRGARPGPACHGARAAQRLGRGAAGVPHARVPGFRARTLRERQRLSGCRRHAGVPRRLRGGRRRGRGDPECDGGDHAGAVPPRLRADRRPAPRRARPGRRLLRVQRLRRRDRAAQARAASSASPTWTSTPTTAMGCSTRSRTTPRWCSPTCTRTGAICIPGTGAAEEIGRGAASGTKLNLPLPPGADDCGVRRRVAAGDRASGALRTGIHHPAVRRGQPRGRSDHAPALLAAVARSRRARAGAAGRTAAVTGGCWPSGGGGYNRTNLAQAWNAVVENLM